MAASNFGKCLEIVLVHEGGYVDHPLDPGGATNRGVTIKTLSDWLGRPATKAEVRALTVADVTPIYRKNYWDRVSGDRRPAGADLVVFDAAVNSGPGRALQWSSQVSQRALDAAAFVHAYCDVRLGFLRRLGTWDAFGRGWSRRVADIRAKGVVMARKASGLSPEQVKAQTMADANAADAKAGKDVKRAGAAGAGGAATGGGVVTQTEPNALGWAAIAFVAVIVIGAVVYLVVRANNRMDETEALRRAAAEVPDVGGNGGNEGGPGNDGGGSA